MSNDKYYVYHVLFDDEIIYVGKGQGNRYKHPTSGKSHNYNLNILWFRHILLSETKPITKIMYTFNLECDALSKEQQDISKYLPRCNIRKEGCLLGYSKGRNVSLEDFISYSLGREDGRRLLYHRMYHCTSLTEKERLRLAMETIPDKRENNGGGNKGFAGRCLKGDSAGQRAYGRYKKKYIKDNDKEPTEEESLSWLEIRNNKKGNK